MAADDQQLDSETRQADREQAHIPEPPTQPQNPVENRQGNIKLQLDRNGPQAAVEAGAQRLEKGGLKILKNAHLPCPPQQPVRRGDSAEGADPESKNHSDADDEADP